MRTRRNPGDSRLRNQGSPERSQAHWKRPEWLNVYLGGAAIVVAVLLSVVIPRVIPASGEPDPPPQKSAQTTDPLRDLAFNYIRLFGAYETGAVVQMWKGRWLSIPGKLPIFFNNWEYRNAKPIANSLWDKISEPKYIMKYFSQSLPIEDFNVARDCAWYLLGGDGDPDKIPNCSKKYSKDVGYLFLIIENISDHFLENIHLEFTIVKAHNSPNTPINITNVFSYSISEIQKANEESKHCKKNSVLNECSMYYEGQIVPMMRPHDQFVLSIFVYKPVNANTFAGKLFDNAVIPISVDMISEGKPAGELVRPPLRDAAARVMLPDGWYYQ